MELFRDKYVFIVGVGWGIGCVIVEMFVYIVILFFSIFVFEFNEVNEIVCFCSVINLNFVVWVVVVDVIDFVVV